MAVYKCLLSTTSACNCKGKPIQLNLCMETHDDSVDPGLASFLYTVLLNSPHSCTLALQNAATSSIDSIEQVAFQMSSFAGYHGNSEAFTNQLIRCHALVLDRELCVRVNTIPAYMEVNRMVGCVCTCTAIQLCTYVS